MENLQEEDGPTQDAAQLVDDDDQEDTSILESYSDEPATNSESSDQGAATSMTEWIVPSFLSF